MPPVNQGSRSLMAAWIVVMAIVGVVSSIVAIYFYVDSNKVNLVLKTQNDQYADVLPPSMLTSEYIEELKQARANEVNGFDSSMKLFEVALAQRDRLAKFISGGDDEGKAVITVNQAIGKVKEAGITPAGDNLSAAVEALLTEVNARRTEAASNKADSEQSKKTLDETLANQKETVDRITRQLEEVRAENEQARAQLQELTTNQRTAFDTTAGELRQQLEAAQEQVNALNADNTSLNSQIERLKRELQSVQDRLAQFRVDPAKTVVRQADGQISRIVERGFVYIDIGSSDRVTRGLTFEVFDKVEGIPEAGDPTNDENLPKGKASIEVLEAFQGGSKCRVTRLSPGAVLSEGDLIVNIVYDRNTEYNFVVYGNFDLDRNGTATAQDAEVIKHLITSWGGKVVNTINVDTDFVVLGKDPEIPERPTDDPPDPLAQRQWEEAMAAYDEYGRISKEARDYRIPILNQNRFLYLSGYYEQAKR